MQLNALQLLTEELKSLRCEGVEGLYVSDDVWVRLADFFHARPQAATIGDSKAAPQASLKMENTAENTAPAKAATGATLPAAPIFTLPDGDKQTRWNWLRERVINDPVCKNSVKPGKRVVFGVGNLDASIFFCGEAPGAEEEIAAEPFVGPAGQLLTKIITAMGLTREQVYIGNILNWRPDTGTSYGNRAPTLDEMNYCLPFLRAQVEIVAPKVIVALGATAVTGLLGPNPKRRMGDVCGTWAHFMGIPVMITYHPSYILRNPTPETKKAVWGHMQAVLQKLAADG